MLSDFQYTPIEGKVAIFGIFVIIIIVAAIMEKEKRNATNRTNTQRKG